MSDSHRGSFKWVQLDLGCGLRHLNFLLGKMIKMASGLVKDVWHLGQDGWSSWGWTGLFLHAASPCGSHGFLSVEDLKVVRLPTWGLAPIKMSVPRHQDRDCKASSELTSESLFPQHIGNQLRFMERGPHRDMNTRMNGSLRSHCWKLV